MWTIRKIVFAVSLVALLCWGAYAAFDAYAANWGTRAAEWEQYIQESERQVLANKRAAKQPIVYFFVVVKPQ